MTDTTPHPTGNFGALHHLELWVADLEIAERSWEWLMTELGYEPYQRWSHGRSWRLGATYFVVEQSPDLLGSDQERRRPGLNHVAFHAGTTTDVDRLVDASADHGWALLFADRHPYAGGRNHYAAYLADPAGFEVELCASSPDG